MKKVYLFFFVFGCMIICMNAMAQSKPAKEHNHPSGKQYSVSAGTTIPIGDFSSTHAAGVSAIYSWTNHRLGGMSVRPVKTFGFTANGGITYFVGKEETISGYPYRYPGYFFVHVHAGTIYNPWKKGNISLTAGPAIGIYNGHTQFNIGSILEGSYYIKVKIAITPGIIFMKESGADPLWSASLKATLAF